MLLDFPRLRALNVIAGPEGLEFFGRISALRRAGLRPRDPGNFSTRRQTHGQESSQDREEDRPEGEEGHWDKNARHEVGREGHENAKRRRPREMTYTRSQLHERISDLSGQYRAAQENKRLTSQKRAEDERLADLSRQADEKADGHLLEIAAQINEAKAQYAAAVDEIIEPADKFEVTAEVRYHYGSPPDVPEPPLAYNSIFTEGADLHSQLLAKAEANMNGAYDEATR